MGIIERIILFFSERVLFCTIGAVTRTCSGDMVQQHAHDWVFRHGIIEAITAYRPKRIYVVSNEDNFTPRLTEDDIKRKYDAVKSVLNACTRAYVDYMYCKSKDDCSPLRMPNTGIVEFFSREHVGEEFDTSRILLVGDNEEARVCAERLHCKYMSVLEFIEEYKSKH